MALQNITMRVEDLVREMRRILMDEHDELARYGSSNLARKAHDIREQRLLEIKEELGRIAKIAGPSPSPSSA